MQGFFKRAADGHRLADGFHLRRQQILGLRKLFKGEARHLDHHVIDRRLETSRRLAGDVIGNLVQRVTHGQLGRDLGNRKPGGLAGQRRAARDPRIHLDHHHAPVFGTHRKLDIGTAGIDADLANDPKRGIAHDLIFLVGQGLRRSHGNGIAGMDSHGIEILDGADDHDVILVVTHHLQLEFFPTQNRFFDENLVNR